MPETRFGLLQLHSLGSVDLDIAVMDITPLPRMKLRLRPAAAPCKIQPPPFIEGKRRNSSQATHGRVSRSSFVVYFAADIKKTFFGLLCTRSHDLKFKNKLAAERGARCLSQGKKLLKAKRLRRQNTCVRTSRCFRHLDCIQVRKLAYVRTKRSLHPCPSTSRVYARP